MKSLKYFLVVGFSVAALICSVSMAESKKSSRTAGFTREYGMAGCGLGSMVVGKRGGQIFASTTNMTLWNQSFGITFNSLNCIDSATEQAAHRMDNFILVNQVTMADDIAKGNGETLASISSILHCSDSALLNSKLQGNFSHIFPNYEVAPNEVTDSIISVIMTDDGLSKSCKITG